MEKVKAQEGPAPVVNRIQREREHNKENDTLQIVGQKTNP